jgi:DNA recombination protein RmuC
MLKAVAYAWKQDALAQNAREISALGRELYDRMSTLGEHLRKIGASLNGSVTAYNFAVGSLESRVLPSARRFRDLGAAGTKTIPELKLIDRIPTEPTSTELREGSSPVIEPPDDALRDVLGAVRSPVGGKEVA